MSQESTKTKRARELTRRDFVKGGGVAVAATAASALGFPAVLRAQAAEIKVGHIHPLTGGLALDGNQLRKGLLQAVDEINGAGGIHSMGGAKLKLLDGDSEGKPETAIAEMQRFNNEGCIAVLGAYQSAVTLVATQEAEKFKLPFVVTVAVADEVTQRGFKYVFRCQPSAEQMATQGLEHLAQIAKAKGVTVKTLAYMHDNTAFGQPLFAHVQKLAPKYGMEVVADVPYSPRAPDVNTEVNKIKLAQADVVLDTGYLGDGIRVLRTMRDLRVQAKAIMGIANGAFSHPKFVVDLGPLAEHVMDGNYRADPNSPVTKAAFTGFRKRYNEDMDPSTVYAYQPMYVLKDALERAGKADRDAVRDALAKTHLTHHMLPQGPIVFDAGGQNINARAVVTQVQSGHIKVVWPTAYAEGQVVFPVPA
jgi:branched-chain amino acid transport system substrate-binding protein